ncbi:PREDICTED: uncharacterized protein LOC104810700 [Tarenaya hassleriana]|uniref:uncharacterized protein LOC104810700 n=1 Tax=Tarenaya hassleriana TaxID=28532 RepID=UPI00053C8F8B|nr:PREDICTED: uncharacterized protein LOC104810700 [Tarenaya hassleriana]
MGSQGHEMTNSNVLFRAFSGSSEELSHASGEDKTQIKKDQKPIRAMTSKEYSKNYRSKQFQKVAKLEAEAKSLQAEIVAKRPAIKCKEEENLMLRAENDMMRQKLSQCSSQLMHKQAEYRALKEEIERMKKNIASSIIGCPGVLNNLDSTTIQLLRFSLLRQSGPSTTDPPPPLLHQPFP